MIKELELESFVNVKETALVGRSDGEALLTKLEKEKYDLKILEKEYEKIIIIIPDKVVTINKSYFLGLFKTRVEDLGKEGFLKKYEFKATDYINEKIKRCVDAASLSAPQKEILESCL